ncbi:MAG: bifunctional diaminohydroxyphosphoribosylaminopyrimidine deaminase/5-amino-6-(5-phosphoribosylamino)uracil reductase RibD [Lewinella sp.]|nr:bifunctional diaminohydroxyphosphoribosylaminopyrimidine deaminase/5-amino-6-(5-phosphoribosylamino)uracil reductase RibD [Lewinella sp.]
MQRAFDLAARGRGATSPNPIVGAVLVYEGRIIGEGYHAHYGGPHAEVHAVGSVRAADRSLISRSTLYVSLEPCNIYGKTPPCTDLILRERIPRVVVAQRDFTPGVDGSGLARLRAAGVEVIEGMLGEDGFRLSLPRNVLVTEHRPYILLKYAQTQDGFLARTDGQPLWITNAYSRRLVHKWRTETDAILVGARTARLDDPALTNRLYPGRQPWRVVIDRQHRLPSTHQLLDGQHPTWIFAQSPSSVTYDQVRYSTLDFTAPDWPRQLLRQLYEARIGHLTVEGGAWLLRQFLSLDLWDEARVFTGPQMLGQGLPAPSLAPARAQGTYQLAGDQLDWYFNPTRSEALSKR